MFDIILIQLIFFLILGSINTSLRPYTAEATVLAASNTQEMMMWLSGAWLLNGGRLAGGSGAGENGSVRLAV